MPRPPKTAEQMRALQGLLQTPAAYLLGVSARKLRDYADAPRLDNDTYDAKALVAWWTGRAAGSADPDPLLAGGMSPALERYRLARASREELELDARRRVLLPREGVHHGLAAIARIIRGCGERLQRQCGREALEILNESLDDAQREIDRLCGDGNGGSEE